MYKSKFKKELNHPLNIVIFGGTGDLAEKKLLPALFDLYSSKCLPEAFSIIGLARSDKTDSDYRDFVKKALINKGAEDQEKCDEFISHVFYKKGDIKTEECYLDLKNYLSEKDDSIGSCTNKMFHLSVPPSLYEPIFKSLAVSGLTKPCEEHQDGTWTRVLVEKPFGNNKKEAQKLDELLGELFDENQIFRIDHYVAKEALQNVITFRFANALFEPVWNSNSIERVDINLYESFGVRDRGASYDGVGALRDVGQNHLLQMLALIAMEDPGELNADKIRKSRADVLDKVILFNNENENSWRAQYEGYLDEKNVDKESETETYFKLKLGIDNPRWKGVPFYLESGKSLHASLAEMVITFKQTDSCVCPKNDNILHKNKIVFTIQPNEKITIGFWAKRPGFDYKLDEKNLSFSYDNSYSDNEEQVRLPDAYERILFDCIRGDQTLFVSTDEIKSQWKLIMPILDYWKKTDLIRYKQGSHPKLILEDNK